MPGGEKMSETKFVAVRYGDKHSYKVQKVPPLRVFFLAKVVYTPYKLLMPNGFTLSLFVQVHHRLGATALPMMLAIEPAMMHMTYITTQ